MDRATIEELLRRRIGLDPASGGPGLLARATRARMKALGIAESDTARYHALVEGSEREFQALVEEVVVPESWFFRDDHPFALLADRAAAGWLADPSRPPLRALSMPCAGGEEAYSIAIALIDRGLPTARFHVDAVDVSRSVLDAARAAVYTANAFRSKDLLFRDRHFRPTPAGFALSEEVKAAVAFQPGNLLDPGLLAGESRYDVIFCRNLLIYFDDPARKQALANLDRLLGPSGLLFVGHAEGAGLPSGQFRPTADRRCFAFERVSEQAGSEPRSRAADLPSSGGRGSLANPGVSAGAGKTGVRKRAPATPDRKAGPPPSVIRPRPEAPVIEANLLGDAAKLADAGRHDEAARLCEQEIRRGGSSPAPYFLLGVIRQAAGDREAAERSFEKAVYLDPGHEEALLALSFLAQRRGDLATAASYRRRAERAYQEKHPQ